MEIASSIGINYHTLYDRTVTDKGMMFSEYSQKMSAKGESRLRAHQYAKALGLTDKGDNTLLIFLGKVRLKQREAALDDASLTLKVEHVNPLSNEESKTKGNKTNE